MPALTLGATTLPRCASYRVSVVWTEPVRAFAERKNLQGTQRKILVTGLASARAREGLPATGWSVQEHSKR